MKLYHVSHKDLGKKYTFTPRIPTGGAINEDTTTRRVSAAESVYYCYLGREGIKDLTRYTSNDYKWILNRSPCVVYEFNVSDNDIYIPTVQEVCDVLITKEYWILTPVVGVRIGYVSNEDLHYNGEIVIRRYDERFNNLHASN